MAIQYFATKEEAESVPNSQLSWCIVKDGKHWCAETGSDITPSLLDPDREALKAYAKLAALKNMSPSQVSTWVDANVTNLAQAQDAIKTLAIGVGYIIRSVF